MKRYTLLAGIMLPVLAHLACDAVQQSNSDPSSPSGDSDQTSGASSDANDTASDQAAVPDDAPADDTTAALAGSAAAAVAKAVAAILPVTDLQAIFEQGAPLPPCPVLDMEPGTTTIPLTMNYGSGCTPARYPLVTFSGTAAGTAFIAVSAFDFTFAALAINDNALGGTIAGSFLPSGGTVRFVASASLILSDGTQVRANIDANVDVSTGALTLPDTVLQARPDGTDPMSIHLTDVAIDPAATGSFEPVSGVAEVTTSASDTPSTVNFGS